MPPPKPTFFHGSKNAVNDARYASSHKTALKNLKCSPTLSTSLSLETLFDVDFVAKYVYEELERILGIADEVLGDMLINMLFTLPTPKLKLSRYANREEEVVASGIKPNKNIDPKEIQLMLNDFIGVQQAYTFMEQLWSKLTSDIFVFKERDTRREQATEKHTETDGGFRHSDPLSPSSNGARRMFNDDSSRQRQHFRSRYFDSGYSRAHRRSPQPRRERRPAHQHHDRSPKVHPHAYQRFSPRRQRGRVEEPSHEQSQRQYQSELHNETAHSRPSHSPAHSNASTYSSQHSHHDDWDEPQAQTTPNIPLHPLPRELEQMLRERATASRSKQSQ